MFNFRSHFLKWIINNQNIMHTGSGPALAVYTYFQEGGRVRGTDISQKPEVYGPV